MSAVPVSIVALGERAWIYPLKGIAFFLTNSYLWPLFRSRLVPILFISLFIYVLLFAFAYLPQAAFLALFQGRNGFVSAVFLVLSEGAAASALVFETFFVDDTLVKVFDATLVARGEEDLVAQLRSLEPFSHPSIEDGHEIVRNPVQRLGALVGNDKEYAPFSFSQICIYIISLPIGFIPVIGPFLFLLVNGKRAGAVQHHRYFRLRGFTRKERKAFVNQRSWPYRSFGAMTLALQLVPVLSMFFLLTSAAGSAIWAADLEQRRRIEDEFSPLVAPRDGDEEV